ncbi:hypothetical protein C8Q74DRAFT_290617 [Fomes fomentarius]|nr:hypothetical protein C8Q74DRAFT_290617 [Fomes fomentarius]
MKDGKQRVKPDTGAPSGRGTYAKQACSHCRKRKSKCDGRAPVCGPCEKAGRAAECTWGKETAKKARTQQHFESLENYIRALEAKVKDLQADLEHCRQNHGGPSPAASSDAGLHASTSLLPRRESSEPEIPTDDEGHTTTTSDSDIEHLISPTRHLLVRAYPSSVISVFFFAPSDASRNHFSSPVGPSPCPRPCPAFHFSSLRVMPISPHRCALVVMLWSSANVLSYRACAVSVCPAFVSWSME